MIKKAYGKIFARIYDPFMKKFEARILAERRHKLLSGLEGKILDVGSGTGANFPYFSKDAEVIAIEPSIEMSKRAKIKHQRTESIHIINQGINEVDLPQYNFDYIVCTLVLCTVPDPEKAIQNFKKWLKPNGKLIILEHVQASSHLRRKMYDLANPIWSVVAEGCNLNRPTTELIEQLGFVSLENEKFKVGLDFHQGVFVLGNTSE